MKKKEIYMGSFRTSSVFRFTKDFDLLKKIIRDGIIPNYCEEDLTFDDESEFVVGIPMASFCDIPIMLLDEHNSRYGNYGIALSKQWAIENGLTPVMYIANSDVARAVYFHHTKNEKVLKWYNRADVKAKLINDTIYKSFPLKEFAKMMGAQQEHSVNTHIIGYLKKYEGKYKGKKINNYEENEWRYLVPDEDGTKWFWSKEEYLNWRFPKGNKDADKPLPSDALKKYTLKFNLNEVSYILIKDDEFKARLIEFIKKLKTIGGYPVREESQNDDLISKIITLYQVKMDF
jgi:hypothetical protein